MTRLYKVKQAIVFFACISAFVVHFAQAGIPITTDSRIKTLVYNENEVFHLTLHYGYQSNIEFANNEEIETLSVGNSYSWKITPVGRRLFIKALEGAARTNMTVITNKRTYQFEIESKDPDDNLDEELVYVVRFFYPDASFDKPLPKIDTRKFMPAQPVQAAQMAPQNSYNFSYSITGPDKIAPVKIFDDGKELFLQFPNNNALLPYIFIIGPDNTENRTTYSRQGEYIVIKSLPEKLVLRLNQDTVNVFKEK